MNAEMLMILDDIPMLEALLNQVPYRLLPPEIVSNGGIVYELSLVECSVFNLPFECIEDESQTILEKESIGMYCPVNNSSNVIKLPYSTENWRVEDEYTRWVISIYTLGE
jgi:hypothetical protein